MNFEIITTQMVNGVELFSFSQKKINDKNQKIVSVFCDSEDSVVVFYDEELLLSNSLEVRGDGIWSDVIQEVENVHWSLSMESFALRLSINEFNAQVLHQDLIGERIPYGYDLDCESNDHGETWSLHGNIIVGLTYFTISNEKSDLSFIEQ